MYGFVSISVLKKLVDSWRANVKKRNSIKYNINPKYSLHKLNQKFAPLRIVKFELKLFLKEPNFVTLLDFPLNSHKNYIQPSQYQPNYNTFKNKPNKKNTAKN